MNELVTDIKKLHEETLENLKSSKANNTLRAYKSDFRDFSAFCAKHGFSSMPTLPEVKYVDESELQMPLKVYTKDGVLIGEFGEIKRRSIDFDSIPLDIKNAFLAAEDDNFLIIRV